MTRKLEPRASGAEVAWAHAQPHENVLIVAISEASRSSQSDHQRSAAAQRGGVLCSEHNARTERHVRHRGDEQQALRMRGMRSKRGTRAT